MKDNISQYKLLLLNLLDYRTRINKNDEFVLDELLERQLKSSDIDFDSRLLEYLYVYLSVHADLLKKVDIKYLPKDKKFALSYVDSGDDKNNNSYKGRLEYISLVDNYAAPIKKETTKFEHLTEFKDEEEFNAAKVDFWWITKSTFDDCSYNYPSEIRNLLRMIIDYE